MKLLKNKKGIFAFAIVMLFAITCLGGCSITNPFDQDEETAGFGTTTQCQNYLIS